MWYSSHWSCIFLIFRTLFFLYIPTMSSRIFVNKEKSISETIRENAFSDMIQAGLQEVALAVEAGDVDVGGIPQIVVTVDGAWSKRSYKSNYNASSGITCVTCLEAEGWREKKTVTNDLECAVRPQIWSES
ncbi:hypothetical protein BDFB_013853 [Asbolus verrucosus]|uniref:Mutator-like transposase domain-containing protein n=1 Tax=Asbolus verrucosus TaxID=1661398 RepID=A0A482VF66_ASBVE|nr:hypothetical protein BDFB_013853 [Asbolus verrucosus]